jgi:aminotransferase EvaB
VGFCVRASGRPVSGGCSLAGTGADRGATAGQLHEVLPPYSDNDERADPQADSAWCLALSWLTTGNCAVKVPLNDLSRGPGACEELRQAVARVAASGWYVQGPEHAAFEREFAEFCGVSDCVGVASGTDALELALRAVASPASGAVLTAANAGGYASVAARRAGFDVRYSDIDAATLCLDTEAVAARLEGVAVVVVTHLYGRLAPVEPIIELCRRGGIAVVEDCAQAAGARRDGRRAGSFGDAAAFSFYPTKNLAALGDGGAVLTSSGAVAENVRRLRQYGWSRKYAIEVDGGRNSRLDEMQAAALRVRLRQLDEENEQRRVILRRYAEAACNSSITVPAADGEGHVAHLAVALTDDREAVRARFAAAGVQTDVHYPIPDHRQAAYIDQYQDVILPVTENVTNRIFTLPCFPQLTDEEVDAVCACLRAEL